MSNLLVTIKDDETLEVPSRIAQCPECGGMLIVCVMEYSMPDRRATLGGISIDCESEDDENDDTRHRHYQSDWQPIYDRIYNWMYDNVRIADEGDISE